MKPIDGHDANGQFIDKPGAISTWTGLRVDPLDAAPEELRIEDIAHALARQCRYNGHCDGFLSVARHSIWVSERLERHGRVMALWGLLHDAAETYLGDLVRPLKHSDAMRLYREAEDRLEAVVAEAFGLPFPMPAEVHEADTYVCTELEMPDYRSTWVGSIEDDEAEFLARYMMLTGKPAPARVRTILIALAGPKRVGKDTIAGALIEKHGFEQIAFADKLRAVALGADPYVKIRIGEPMNPQGFGSMFYALSFVVERLGWDKAKEIADVRRLLERLGTEGVRDHLGITTWIDAALADVQPGGRYVFTDCRFENEADAVISRGGSVWRVERPGFEPDASHVSQAVLIPPEKIARVIVNDGTRADLRRAVLSEWTPA